MTLHYKARRVCGKKIDEHRYVMECHIGRPLLSSEVVHHIDGNKQNNSIDNLQIVSHAEHLQLHKQTIMNSLNSPEAIRKRADTLRKHFKEHKPSTSKQIAQIDVITGEVLRTFKSIRDVDAAGFNHRHVSACCSGKRKTHKGYKWMYSADVAQLVEHRPRNAMVSSSILLIGSI